MVFIPVVWALQSRGNPILKVCLFSLRVTPEVDLPGGIFLTQNNPFSRNIDLHQKKEESPMGRLVVVTLAF